MRFKLRKKKPKTRAKVVIEDRVSKKTHSAIDEEIEVYRKMLTRAKTRRPEMVSHYQAMLHRLQGQRDER